MQSLAKPRMLRAIGQIYLAVFFAESDNFGVRKLRDESKSTLILI